MRNSGGVGEGVLRKVSTGLSLIVERKINGGGEEKEHDGKGHVGPGLKKAELGQQETTQLNDKITTD